MTTPDRTRAALADLEAEVIRCQACPRLVAWREKIAREKRATYRKQEYWGRPVPGFGDPKARLLIVGLAPGAHGSNRTGRMFTGDRSGDWLYGALHRFGFASQPEATSVDDGLQLFDAFVTAALRCAPPDNHPLPEERSRCRPFLEQELDHFLPRLRCIVSLGDYAFTHILRVLRDRGHPVPTPRPKFRHGGELAVGHEFHVLSSYHPSQQNTFTGKLTQPAFDDVWQRARAYVDGDEEPR